MIAYDFDGVIQADFNYVRVDQETFEKVHIECRPIFVPEGRYIIVTGRHEVEKINQYIEKYVLTQPVEIYYNKQMLDPVQFKIDTLLALDIDLFIESCPLQTRLLCEAGINAICFNDFINVSIARVSV